MGGMVCRGGWRWWRWWWWGDLKMGPRFMSRLAMRLGLFSLISHNLTVLSSDPVANMGGSATCHGRNRQGSMCYASQTDTHRGTRRVKHTTQPARMDTVFHEIDEHGALWALRGGVSVRAAHVWRYGCESRSVWIRTLV